MIRPLILVTISYLAAGCAPRFAGTHFDRWAQEDQARRAAQVAPPAAPAPASAPSAPSTPPPAPPAPSAYPDESSSGRTDPDVGAESGGRAVRPPEDDEVLY